MKKLLANLSLGQRIMLAIVAIVVGAGLYGLVHWRQEADFRPLFEGLAPEDAGGIVQKLKESGVEYRLGEGGATVLAPSERIAELRISMAAEGLPKTGRIGFELFDKENLGATDFTEHVNYRRALEGELERSVMSLAAVEQARVHVTFPQESVFTDQQQPAKASVLVRLRPGARLAPPNVAAIDNLVASAVDGLSPDAVSVLDMNGNLLGRPKAAGGLDGPEPSEAALDYRRKVEADLVTKVSATLEPLLGAGRFRAGASVDCDFTGGEQSEEIFDPEHSVMVSSERTEDASGPAASGGVPGTASTLPRPASRPGSGGSRVSRVTENIAYETSRTVKKSRTPAGEVRKISLAVLVDQTVSWEKAGNAFRRVLTPPSAEQLKAIHDLVAGVTGLNPDRGDQLIVETMPFETTLLTEPPQSALPAPPAARPPLPFAVSVKTLEIVGGAALALLLILTVALLRRRTAVEMEANAPPALSAAAGASPAQIPQAGGQLEQQFEAKMAEREAQQQKLDAQALSALKLAPPITKTAEILAKHLRDKVKDTPDVAAHVLQSWIREEGGY
jgi:flagellar M-ring protein FliF